MKPLARTQTRPPGTKTSRPSTPKVVFVRQPVRPATQIGHADRLPLRLAIATLATITAVVGLWLAGMLGYRLGFAPAVRIPELVGDAGGGLATGALMLIAMPAYIIDTGLANPLWLMLAFLLIAPPAGGLAVASPTVAGGPRPSQLAHSSSIAAVLGMSVVAIILLWWTSSSARTELLRELPDAVQAASVWVRDLEVAAGLDVLGLIAAILWTILMVRLPVPGWLRALSTSTGAFVLVVVAVATSVSTATAVQVSADRSVGWLDPETREICLVLGSTREHFAVLRVENDRTLVELYDRPTLMTVTGRESIEEFLLRHVIDDDGFGLP